MKCVKNPSLDEVKRVSNEEAEEYANGSGWVYCSKQEWRDHKKPSAPEGAKS